MEATVQRPDLVLASASPRRQELLEKAGFLFRAHPSHTEEPDPAPGESLRDWVMGLALKKAHASCATDSKQTETSIYLGSDTTVVLRGRVFGKPKDEADAASMLRALSGHTHTVMTSWAVLDRRSVHFKDVSCAEVTWSLLSERAIEKILSYGEWRDKAGAYAFQGLAMTWIKNLQGEPATVMGLPIADVAQALEQLGCVRWVHAR